MTRHQLEHVIRAAAATADVKEIVVIGSQSILGTHPDAPAELTISMEADVFPKEAPARSIVIDGSIGEESLFHQTFGYYGHGVDERTAVLPEGWQNRLIKVSNSNTMGAIGWCLEPNDIAVSKLVAGREKDLQYVTAMIQHRLAAWDVVCDRLVTTPLSPQQRELATARLNARRQYE
jgi:hypothetical protein